MEKKSRLPSLLFWQPSRHIIPRCRCGVLLLNTTGEQWRGQLWTRGSQDSCLSEGYARHICPFVPEDLASFPAAAVVTCEILHPDCLLHPQSLNWVSARSLSSTVNSLSALYLTEEFQMPVERVSDSLDVVTGWPPPGSSSLHQGLPIDQEEF